MSNFPPKQALICIAGLEIGAISAMWDAFGSRKNPLLFISLGLHPCRKPFFIVRISELYQLLDYRGEAKGTAANLILLRPRDVVEILRSSCWPDSEPLSWNAAAAAL